MAAIDIHRNHNLSVDEAKRIVDDLAKSMATRFGIHCTWQDDALCFSRSGVDGRIAVNPGAIHVHAKLGLLMRALQPVIEQEITRQMDARLR